MHAPALIEKYFPELSEKQIQKLLQLEEMYQQWNAVINVISRKDISHLFLRHILHSMAISKVIQFSPEAKVLDVGTGGGLPGIPLSILFPETEFLLVDSIGKKIKVVQEIIQELQLENTTAIQSRAEQIQDKFHFVVNRAVTAMPNFIPWVEDKFLSKNIQEMPNGILSLKGGDLQEELQEFDYQSFPIADFYDEEFFDTKKIIYIPAKSIWK